MPFFNFRRGGGDAAATASAAPESVETLRRRARHRLIGSAVLVLAGVIGFPLVFDTQPRPVAIDIPIEIPSKAAVKPLGAALPPVVSASPSPEPVPARPATPGAGEKVTAAGSLAPDEEIVSAKPAAKPSEPVKAEAEKAKADAAKVKPQAKVEAKASVKPDPKPEPKLVDDAARARALLNGTEAVAGSGPAKAADGNARMVVQVGAFADVVKAREARVKLESAGLKTYTQVAETADGRRIRVRVGPFATRADADKAASKIKTLGLPAAVLTL